MFFGLIFLFFSLYVIPLKSFHYLLRPFCWLSCFFAGQWLKKEGDTPEDKKTPYIYMFNHVSMFDQFMVVAFLKHYTTAIGAYEEFRWPIFGAVAKKYGGIPIDREHLKKAIGTLKRAEEIIKEIEERLEDKFSRFGKNVNQKKQLKFRSSYISFVLDCI